MRDQEDVKKLFKEDVIIHFDFSKAPNLIRRKQENEHVIRHFEEKQLTKWAKAQNSFIRWTEDRKVFSKEYVGNSKALYDSFFKKRDYLKGNVLDIGGGWGLYRYWWQPGENEFYVIHDPGVERFLRGVHKIHQDFYERALSLPMTFVEGFGEELPYKNEVFDTCIIAAALDHCIDPGRVLAEAYRCLKTAGGTILVLQSCRTPRSKDHRPHILTRLLRLLCNPKRLLREIYLRLFYQDHHLHHFYPSDITLWLEQAGFLRIQTSNVTGTSSVYAFEAKK